MPALKKFSVSSLILWGMVFVTGAYFIYYLATPYWFEKESEPRSQEFLGKIAAEINRSGPVMIDQETELMPAAGAPGMLIYNYRLVSYSTTQLDHNKFAAGAKESPGWPRAPAASWPVSPGRSHSAMPAS